MNKFLINPKTGNAKTLDAWGNVDTTNFIEITQVQDEYVDGIEEAYYTARAEDKDGNDYEIIWYFIEGRENDEDGHEHCDWEEPSEVNKL